MTYPVYLAASVRARMVEHAAAEAAFGRECVGLLVAPEGEWMQVGVYEVRPLVNTSSEPERTFVVDQDVLLAEMAAVRREKLLVMGVYHSHLTRPAQPSETDIVNAFWPHHFIIAPNARPARQVRFWHIAHGRATERAVEEA